MRTGHNPNFMAFRASDALAAAISERARAAGVSMSEYLRTIARERVGLQ
jgi:hypothetical protein